MRNISLRFVLCAVIATALTTIVSAQTSTPTATPAPKDLLNGRTQITKKGTTPKGDNDWRVVDAGKPNATKQKSAKAAKSAAKPKEEVTFSSSTTTITKGDGVVLSWNAPNADKIEISEGVGDVTGQDSKSVRPDKDVTYVLTATTNGKPTRRSVTVVVNQPPAPIETWWDHKLWWVLLVIGLLIVGLIAWFMWRHYHPRQAQQVQQQAPVNGQQPQSTAPPANAPVTVNVTFNMPAGATPTMATQAEPPTPPAQSGN